MCPELDQKTHVSHLLFHGNLLNALTQQEKISSAGAIITSISSVPICFWPSESDPSGSSGPHILKIPLSLISSFPISLPFFTAKSRTHSLSRMLWSYQRNICIPQAIRIIV